MGHCGTEKMYEPGLPLHRYLLIPTSPDIVNAWTDFFLGSVLHRSWFIDGPKKIRWPPRQSPKQPLTQHQNPHPADERYETFKYRP